MSTFFNATDLLTVASANGNSFTLDVNNNTSPANGTLNALLVNGTLNRTEDKLTFNGNLQLPAEFDTLFDQTVTLTNVVLYDLNASNNQELWQNFKTDTTYSSLLTALSNNSIRACFNCFY